MVLHSILLIAQCCANLLGIVPRDWAPRYNSIIYTIIPIIDLTVQLLICYICFKLGASDQLKRFDCFLIEDGQGNFIVKYKLKEGVPQAVGEAYYADGASENTESE